MIRLFILPLLLLSTIICAQDYWVSARLTGLFDESLEMIKTSDGGFLSVGTFNSLQTRVVKFSPDGNIEWQKDIPADPTAFVTVSLAVVEGADKYFIVESSLGSDYLSSIIALDTNGDVINKTTAMGFDINELMIDSNGNLFAIYNELLANQNTIRSLSQDLELLWEEVLPEGIFPIFDANAYIDDQDQIHLCLSDANNNQQAIYYKISNNGTINQQSIPIKTSENVESILHVQLPNGNLAYVQKGGNIAGANPVITLYNPSSEEIVAELELGNYFFWISDLIIIENEIFVIGNWNEDGIWPHFLVLNNDLVFKKYYSIKETILSEIPNLNGADLYEIKTDEEQNIIAAGILLNPHPNLGGLTASGPLNMYIHKNGTLMSDPLSNFNPNYPDALKIYPNPCTERLYINSGSELKDEKIIISDMNGKLISRHSDVNSIDVSKLAAGMYQLKIRSINKEYSNRFIKK